MVLLTAHVLNGKRMGVDIPVNSIIEHPFKIEEVPSIGYIDISSVENWWEFGTNLDRDYLFIRKEINNIVSLLGIESTINSQSAPPVSPNGGEQYYVTTTDAATGDWTGYEGWVATWIIDTTSYWKFEPPSWVGYRLLNLTEKGIAAQLKIGSQEDHFIEYGVPTIVDYGFDYHKTSRLAREERMLRATVEVYNIIPMNVAEALGDITASPLGDMYFRYMEFGIQGTVEDYNKDFNPNPTPSITDWLLSRAPFNGQEPFVSAGYPTGLTLKPWVPIDGTTLIAFADKIYNVLVNGLIN